jgi:formylglycine-generating enzyme required for sulfatase activity
LFPLARFASERRRDDEIGGRFCKAQALEQRMRAEGRIKVEAKIVHGAPNDWFKPGAGKIEWFKDLADGPVMAVVPAGEFIMGSNDYKNEKPPHKVTIRQPFAVGRFTVTFAEWDAAGLPHKPSDVGWGRGRRPSINVSWEDAKAYADWLSQSTGKEYRLPSEAEWEYCCRAGTTTKYAFGENITRHRAQFSEGEWGSAKQTVEVGRFSPNPWGLYDLHGNVWEWCEDVWHDTYSGAPSDGSPWLQSGDASRRVVRGGSWVIDPQFLRSAYRDGLSTDYRLNSLGFRVVMAL